MMKYCYLVWRIVTVTRQQAEPAPTSTAVANQNRVFNPDHGIN